jgi:hypothetical protein
LETLHDKGGTSPAIPPCPVHCDISFRRWLPGDFRKELLDSQFVKERDARHSRLAAVEGTGDAGGLSILEYPLPEVCERMKEQAIKMAKTTGESVIRLTNNTNRASHDEQREPPPSQCSTP